MSVCANARRICSGSTSKTTLSATTQAFIYLKSPIMALQRSFRRATRGISVIIAPQYRLYHGALHNTPRATPTNCRITPESDSCAAWAKMCRAGRRLTPEGWISGTGLGYVGSCFVCPPRLIRFHDGYCWSLLACSWRVPVSHYMRGSIPSKVTRMNEALRREISSASMSHRKLSDIMFPFNGSAPIGRRYGSVISRAE